MTDALDMLCVLRSFSLARVFPKRLLNAKKWPFDIPYNSLYAPNSN